MNSKIKKIIKKKNKSKIVSLTAYSKNISKILDKYCDIILVGDSMANVLYDQKNTHKISLEEVESLPLLCRAAALRFLLTRLIDFYQETTNSLLIKKDPMEYLKKLNFHQSVLKSSEYGL